MQNWVGIQFYDHLMQPRGCGGKNYFWPALNCLNYPHWYRMSMATNGAYFQFQTELEFVEIAFNWMTLRDVTHSAYCYFHRHFPFPLRSKLCQLNCHAELELGGLLVVYPLKIGSHCVYTIYSLYYIDRLRHWLNSIEKRADCLQRIRITEGDKRPFPMDLNH